MTSASNPCPFCDIIDGRAPANLRVVDDHGLIFTPLNPVTPGHVLVVPHEHVPDFTTSPSITADVMALAADYAKAQDGDFNLITSRGEAATQSVFHLHVHLVPRRKDDGLLLPWTDQEKRERLRRRPGAGAMTVAEQRRALFEMVEQHLRTTGFRYVNPDGSPWRRPANSLNMVTLGLVDPPLRPVPLDASAFTVDREDVEGWQPSPLDQVRRILREQEDTALLEEWYGVKRCTARTETEDGLLHRCIRADHPSKRHLSTSGYEWEAEA